MLALVFPELCDLLGVTGETRIRDIAAESNLQGRVRILVASQAGLELKVRFTHVALAALGDRLLYRWRMARMAVRTAHILMLPSGRSDVARGSCMALDTVFIGQGCPGSLSRR